MKLTFARLKSTGKINGLINSKLAKNGKQRFSIVGSGTNRNLHTAPAI